MSRTRNNFIIAAGAAALLFALPAGASANALVLRALGPSAKTYAAGRSLPPSAPIVLQAGDVLTMLVDKSMRTLRGPGTFTLSALPKSLASAGFNTRGRFGAMRTGELPTNPSLWQIDVSQSGKVCLADPKKVMLWRPETEESVTLNIKSGTKAQSVQWEAGQSTLAWPAQVPVAKDAEYLLSWTGNEEPTRLTFTEVSTDPADVGAVAKTLIDNGCQTQLELLMDTMPAEG